MCISLSLYIYMYVCIYIYIYGMICTRSLMPLFEGSKGGYAGPISLHRLYFPMDLRIPLLRTKILLQSNLLKSRIFVRRWAVPGVPGEGLGGAVAWEHGQLQRRPRSYRVAWCCGVSQCSTPCCRESARCYAMYEAGVMLYGVDSRLDTNRRLQPSQHNNDMISITKTYRHVIINIILFIIIIITISILTNTLNKYKPALPQPCGLQSRGDSSRLFMERPGLTVLYYTIRNYTILYYTILRYAIVCHSIVYDIIVWYSRI